MVVDAGRITVSSDLANQEAMQIVREKQNLQYSEEDWQRLEGLMYDKFHIELKDTQVRLYCVSNSNVGRISTGLARNKLEKLYGCSQF